MKKLDPSISPIKYEEVPFNANKKIIVRETEEQVDGVEFWLPKSVIHKCSLQKLVEWPKLLFMINFGMKIITKHNKQQRNR